ncbi:MMPL family transporter [Curtobacterium flaccumfaciens]|uniref:MMPL family transporter n=1 Tax=Curtobacterium flaccumfaciens TaxID=2035 RepID=UPI001E4B69D5|nr:MMPL family transporter [Curtobacterium allii]MCE0459709.1 MMPL family transporter [Curtobacterium allii]
MESDGHAVPRHGCCLQQPPSQPGYPADDDSDTIPPTHTPAAAAARSPTQGATTTWERWDSVRPDGTINPSGMTSLNHYALGAVADWMHRTIGGLTSTAPGYQQMRIAPQPGGDITHAALQHDTVNGRIEIQWGWFGPLISAPQGNPLLSLLPIVIAGILFGLAMDYQVFLVSRIHEAHHRGLSPREAILDGFGRSAPVVVAAAAIMAAVFGGFALSKSSLVGSIALGLAVGVIADAFIVRMIVVPAALALLGKSAWWIPKWLDRILPQLDTEGLALDEDDAPNSAPTRSPAATRV